MGTLLRTTRYHGKARLSAVGVAIWVEEPWKATMVDAPPNASTVMTLLYASFLFGFGNDSIISLSLYRAGRKRPRRVKFCA